MTESVKKLNELSEELSTHDSLNKFDKIKFIKKVYVVANEFGLLDLRNTFNKIVDETPRQMDKEFMKMIMSRFNKNKYQTPISVFDGYWEDNRGLILKDGLSKDYSVSIDEKSTFAVLLVNNSLKDLVLLLTVIAKRLVA